MKKIFKKINCLINNIEKPHGFSFFALVGSIVGSFYLCWLFVDHTYYTSFLMLFIGGVILFYRLLSVCFYYLFKSVNIREPYISFFDIVDTPLGSTKKGLNEIDVLVNENDVIQGESLDQLKERISFCIKEIEKI